MDYAIICDKKSNACITIPKDQMFIIGRAEDANYRIQYPEVSRKQFQIEYNGENWTLKNLSEHNITLLNGGLAEDGKVLKSKDVITISGSTSVEMEFFEAFKDIALPSQLCYDKLIYENQMLANETIKSRKRIRSLSCEKDSYEREYHRLKHLIQEDKNTIKELNTSLIDTLAELDTVMAEYNEILKEKDAVTAVASKVTLQAIEIDVLKTDLTKAIAQTKQYASEINNYKQILKDKGIENDQEPVLSSIEQELSCCICNEVIYQAVTLTCGHTFCKFCLNKWKEQKKDCPICRMPLAAEVPALILDSFIETIAPFLDKSFANRREEIKRERIAVQAPPRSAGRRRARARRSNRGRH